jgi:hypothetical protein
VDTVGDPTRHGEGHPVPHGSAVRPTPSRACCPGIRITREWAANPVSLWNRATAEVFVQFGPGMKSDSSDSARTSVETKDRHLDLGAS